MDFKKILAVGDSHADAEYILRALRVARRLGCDVIFQTGDFGCYENIQGGLDFLRRVEAGIEQYGIPIVFLHGNHDGIVPMWEKYGLTVQESDFDEGGITYVKGCSRGEFVEIRKNLFYAPTGHRWTWSGTTFMAVGGAYSVNRAHMIEGVDWWPEEEITDEQVEFCDAGLVDILFTHDIPEGFELPAIAYKKEYPEATHNREQLRKIVHAVKPQLLVHGHYHSRYGNWYTNRVRDPHDYVRVRVEGLGANRTAEIDEPWMVIDLGNAE